MSAAWVAGTVRARALLDRRVGAGEAGRMALAPNLRSTTAALADTAYQRFLPDDAGPSDTERAIEDTVVWNLRVLAGWLPRTGVEAVRVLAAEFEIRNIDDKLRVLAQESGSAPTPYQLGALATAWTHAAGASSAADLRRTLATSEWGDPGTDEPPDLVAYLRLSAAARLAELHEATHPWGATAAALAVARQRFLIGRPLAQGAQRRARTLIGDAALHAEDWDEFVTRLPAVTVGRVLGAIEDPRELWAAEQRYWSRVEADAAGLVRGSGFRMDVPLGCAVLLLADARRLRGALAGAARGGQKGEDHGSDL